MDLKSVFMNSTNQYGRNSLQQISLLIVEDDPDDVYLIKEYLNADQYKKYSYKHVKTLNDAIIETQNNHFDLILLDLGLPDSGGFEGLKTLNNSDCTVPIVVLTGVDDNTLGEEAIQMGAEDYLPKKIANTLLLSRSINYAIERHRLVLELKRKAELDPLTDLPNRAMIYDKLDFMIQQSERSGQDFALVMLDFDKFKQINDTKGHRFGDLLLKTFADRLKNLMRKSDYVSRYGGDEFFMIVSNYSNETELEELLEKKRELMCAPYQFEFEGKPVEQKISISFGVMKWKSGISASNMLEQADQAMYSSKRSERKSITYY